MAARTVHSRVAPALGRIALGLLLACAAYLGLGCQAAFAAEDETSMYRLMSAMANGYNKASIEFTDQQLEHAAAVEEDESYKGWYVVNFDKGMGGGLSVKEGDEDRDAKISAHQRDCARNWADFQKAETKRAEGQGGQYRYLFMTVAYGSEEWGKLENLWYWRGGAAGQCLKSDIVGYSDNVATAYKVYLMKESKAAEVEAVQGQNDASFEDGHEKWTRVGAYLGFIDSAYEGNVLERVTSAITSAEQSVGYSSIRETSMMKYAAFGRALNDLGLDYTGSAVSVPDMFVRYVFGGFLFVSYHLCVVVQGLMSAVVDLLVAANPFMWMVDGDDYFLFEEAGPATYSGTHLDSAKSLFQDFAKAFRTWAPVMLGICLLLFVWALFMSRKPGKGGMARDFVVRAVFLLCGPLLLINIYSAGLKFIQDNCVQEDSTSTANYMVYSTLVDFEAWARYLHLALPSETRVVVTTESLTSDAGRVNRAQSTAPRELARQINSACNERANELVAALADEGESRYWNDLDLELDDKQSGLAYKGVTTATDLILRFISGDSYTPGAFQSDYMGSLESKAQSQMAQCIEDWKKKVPDDTSILSSGGENAFFLTDDASQEVTSLGKDAGTAMLVTTSASVPGTASTWTYTGGLSAERLMGKMKDVKAAGNAQGVPAGQTYGLSSQAMYTYLSTSFDESGMVVASKNRVSSVFQGRYHKSVTNVGGGVTGVLYLFNASVTLLCAGLLGIFFCLGMMKDAVVKSVRAIAAIPGGAMGSIGSIAKTLIYVLGALVSILGSILLYYLFRTLIDVMNELGFAMVSKVGAGGAGTEATEMLCLIVSSILIAVLTVIAIKNRGAILSVVDEALDSIVSRFIYASGPGGGPHGRGQLGVRGQNERDRDAVMKGVHGVEGAAAKGAALGGMVARLGAEGVATGVGKTWKGVHGASKDRDELADKRSHQLENLKGWGISEDDWNERTDGMTEDERDGFYQSIEREMNNRKADEMLKGTGGVAESEAEARRAMGTGGGGRQENVRGDGKPGSDGRPPSGGAPSPDGKGRQGRAASAPPEAGSLRDRPDAERAMPERSGFANDTTRTDKGPGQEARRIAAAPGDQARQETRQRAGECASEAPLQAALDAHPDGLSEGEHKPLRCGRDDVGEDKKAAPRAHAARARRAYESDKAAAQVMARQGRKPSPRTSGGPAPTKARGNPGGPAPTKARGNPGGPAPAKAPGSPRPRPAPEPGARPGND